MSNSQYQFFVTVPSGLEILLASELQTLGIKAVRPAASGVSFAGELQDGYRVCLWSRIANRVLLLLHEGEAADENALYQQTRKIDWSTHLRAEDTLAVDFFCHASNFTHSHYGALKVKDAIVDQFRANSGLRPSVDTRQPSLRINVYLHRNRARVSLDLSGGSLHRRGYRLAGGEAPLKENLAAALLLRSAWPAMAREQALFADPLCGSGTLLVEAAMILADIAPGLPRERFGFEHWLQGDQPLWEALLAEARERAAAFQSSEVRLFGGDISEQACQLAQENVDRMGLGGLIAIRQGSFETMAQAFPELRKRRGLLVSNLPYGHRVGEQQALGRLYQALGQTLRQDFPRWRLGLLTGATGLVHRLRVPLENTMAVDNGGLACRYLTTNVVEGKSGKPRGEQENAAKTVAAAVASDVRVDDIDSFENRVRKNLKQLRRWREREGISACRIYDADIPNFAVALDIYETNQRHVVVQEYQAPSRVDDDIAARRLQSILSVLPALLEVEPTNLHLKLRKRQKGAEQYQRQGSQQRFYPIVEHATNLLVNFEDYLDTGLFLDHRPVRRYLQEICRGKRFLNLFGYTGAASAHAGVGGATETLTLDMSNTYCEWARQNLQANHLDAASHQVQRVDCIEWLESPADKTFDVILLDPPTFSNSAKMSDSFDVQRDHSQLITRTMARLETDGLLIFSNNYRRFQLAESVAKQYAVQDKSAWSLDQDFQRNRRIHQCWFIRHQQHQQ